MKRTLLLVLLTGSIIYLLSCRDQSNSTNLFVKKDESQLAKIERGRYLAENVANCMHCHSDRDFTKFSGPLKEETRGMGGVAYPKFGALYSSNITPDSATGIGAWTDDEIARAITQGIRRNGDTLFPIMPYYEYSKMNKEDVKSIVAYLRTIKPIFNKIPERKLKTPAGPERNEFMQAVNEMNFSPADPVIEKGRYLVTLAACMSCHTPKTEEDHFIKDQYFGGGDMMGKKFGFMVYSSNISPDSATGIGRWTEQAFVDKFKSFRDPSAYNTNPGTHNTMMPWTMLAQLKDEDIKAMYTYLRSVKPIHSETIKWK
jgi:mono/diheme cytochrome c family protein